VRFICVTDAGRILGLGDLGANGAGIPIGKLQLYTACAGVPPQYLLPMYLDAGTNNEQYLRDPLYLGMRKTAQQPRIFILSSTNSSKRCRRCFPKCCIHFEDWTGTDAVHLLQRYRDKYCVYNDDVQGTAGITLAGMINAAKLKGTKLKDERYLFLGAGSAGIGLANLLCSALVDKAYSEGSAVKRLHVRHQWSSGKHPQGPGRLPETLRAPTRADAGFRRCNREHQANDDHRREHDWRGVPQKVVESMARINDRPVILALSNPTEHAECTAEQAYTWSKGKAIYAAGVQFEPVHYNGQTFLPGQANISTYSRRLVWRSSPRRRSA